MKAYLNTALQVKGNFIEASSEGKPSVVDLDEAEFARLSEMGVVRAATEIEAKIAAMSAIEDAEIVSEEAPKKRGRKPRAETAGETPTEGADSGADTTPGADNEDEI